MSGIRRREMCLQFTHFEAVGANELCGGDVANFDTRACRLEVLSGGPTKSILRAARNEVLERRWFFGMMGVGV